MQMWLFIQYSNIIVSMQIAFNIDSELDKAVVLCIRVNSFKFFGLKSPINRQPIFQRTYLGTYTKEMFLFKANKE